MKESLQSAIDELKRVDHLIYVTLKYTRTVDVLKNVIRRMVECYDYLISAFLLLLEEKNPTFIEPKLPMQRANAVIENFPEQEVKKNIEKYLLFRKILKLEHYDSINEFRRHVALIGEVDGNPIEINIDYLTQHYQEMRDFVKESNKKIFNSA